MAEWQRKINLNPEWSQCAAGEITLQECARSIAAKIRTIEPIRRWNIDERKITIAEAFEAIAADPDADHDEFDGLMTDLYDWGDTALDSHWAGKKVCWIETMMPAREKGTADVE